MMSSEKKSIIVGMSGGVDSSVCAYLLKEEGHKVVGVFMKNWEEEDQRGNCLSSYEYQDVVQVCQQLDLPYYAVNFVDQYKEKVFSHFLKDYSAGYTPNPDILCNKEIKFKVFLETALESLGGELLATGHYARKKRCAQTGEFLLLKGKDSQKDQSYFLYTLNKEILEKVLFPVGDFSKKKVRQLAQESQLHVSTKKDSTGLCFIGERNFRQFLSQFIKGQEGEFCQLDGKVVGKHLGAVFYTLGQRKGLGLGGPGEPWFVVGKDRDQNRVYVERGEFHPALYSQYLIASEVSWVAGRPPGPFPYRCKAKVRYRQNDQDCQLEEVENSPHLLKVLFDIPQRAVTPRQSVVFYQGEICLGGGVIEKVGESYYDRQESLPSVLAT